MPNAGLAYGACRPTFCHYVRLMLSALIVAASVICNGEQEAEPIVPG
jgi:hypothetical protein